MRMSMGRFTRLTNAFRKKVEPHAAAIALGRPLTERKVSPRVRLRIRPGRGDDWEEMREIYAQAARAAWNHILPAEALSELSAPDRWHPGTGADVLVGEFEGQVVGFICVRASMDEDAAPTVGEIGAFYVCPSKWGVGVGRALLSAGVERLAAAGFEEVTLWSEHRNYRPLRFYRSAGWRLDGAERGYAVRGTEIRELRHRLTLINAIESN